MARLFVPPERLVGHTVMVDGDAHRHLTKVLRLTPGAEVTLFDGCGTEIAGQLASVGPRSAEISLGQRRVVPVPSSALTLLQVLPRGARMDLIVQKTTELGISRIVPILGQRSVARSPRDGGRRWQKIAQEAARQSGRADVPEIAPVQPLVQALADAQRPDGQRFVLWEEERSHSLRHALTATRQAVALLIGPEGGLAAEEVTQARDHGFVVAGLGPRILRSETAAIVAVVLVQAAAGNLD